MGQIPKGMEHQMIWNMHIHKCKLRGDRRFMYFEDIELPAISELRVNAFVLASDADIGGSRQQ